MALLVAKARMAGSGRLTSPLPSTSRAALSVYSVLKRVGGTTSSFHGFLVASLFSGRAKQAVKRTVEKHAVLQSPPPYSPFVRLVIMLFCDNLKRPSLFARTDATLHCNHEKLQLSAPIEEYLRLVLQNGFALGARWQMG